MLPIVKLPVTTTLAVVVVPDRVSFAAMIVPVNVGDAENTRFVDVVPVDPEAE